MMRLSLILAGLWFFFKLIMLQLNYDSERVGVMLNLLFLVVIIYIAIRSLKKDLGFFDMLKAGMRPAAIYILLICVAIFIFYKWCDPGYMPGVIETNLQQLEETIVSEGGFEAFAKKNAPIEANSQEEYIESQRENFGLLFSPFARASQSLLALTMLALIYTLMMIGVYKIGRKFIKE
ncbi:MAG: DUF4199 domain-containing protein [Flavobacteriales bacterium]|nr:DUF4199 domain-containing protein [Flavobacteriales bacterium]